MTTPTALELRQAFRALHHDGTFVIPNPFDAGSARLLQHVGFSALATTSAGFSATLGRMDQLASRHELVDHVAALCRSVSLPINVDAERCFAEDAAGIAETVGLLSDAGAAGLSIEDWDQDNGFLDPIDIAADRVAAAVDAARGTGLVVTGRAENHLHGVSDLDDTITRLRAYASAGADVVYAPGLTDLTQIARVVAEVKVPVNVLILRGGPNVPELASVGVRRVSTGGALAWAAYAGLYAAATELRTDGTIGFLDTILPHSTRAAAFTR
jgi:2-methylisocitrate lyase-like PEP mutase family enzyme